MRFWSGLEVFDLLLLCAMLIAARMLAARVPGYQKLALPPAVLAGFLGLAVGPSGFGLVELDAHTIEAVVYHGLAIVFLAMTLRPRGKTTSARGGTSMGFAIPWITSGQAVYGLGLVLAWNAVLGVLHPGVGLMLPLGFSQGPGQALSLGSAWEDMGMVDGAQIGLAVAATGYVVCILMGLVYFHGARMLGWHDPPVPEEEKSVSPEAAVAASGTAFGLEPLMGQLAVVGTGYLVVYGILVGISGLLADNPQGAATVWGFHFLFAIIVATVMRLGIKGLKLEGATDDVLLGRIAGVAVDLGSAAAITAIKFEVVGMWLGPIMAVAIPGALGTLVACIWLARRAFPDRPFSHSLVLFGTLTGTLPTGLTLLRLVDPELRGPAARNMVMGTALSILPAAPMLVVLLPMPVFGWPDTFPGRVWLSLGLLVGYWVLLTGAWRLLGPIRFIGNPLALRPTGAHPLADEHV